MIKVCKMQLMDVGCSYPNILRQTICTRNKGLFFLCFVVIFLFNRKRRTYTFSMISHVQKCIFSSRWHIFVDAGCLQLSRYRLVSDWMIDRNNPIRRKDTESSNRFSDICVRFLYMQEPNEQTKMSMVGNCRAIFRSWGKYAVKDISTLAIIRGRNSFLFNDYSPQGKRILPTCYLFSLSFCLRDFKHRVVAIFMSPCARQ